MQNQSGTVKRRQSIYTVKRADIILIAGCLLSAVLISIFMILCRVEGGAVSVSCDGVEIAAFTFESAKENSGTEYYLIQSIEKTPEINAYDTFPELPEEEAFNLFSITDGVVKMEAADCNDRICVHHSAISAVGESIICLPHKVVITIMGNSDGSSENDNRDSETENEELDGVVE